jgi:hypothetical protein
MPAVFTTSTFTSHYEYRRRRVEYPIRNDPTLAVRIIRYFEGTQGTYVAPTLDTVDIEYDGSTAALPRAYCTGVGAIDHVDGELMRYEVYFNTVPNTHEEGETYSFRFPGFGGTYTPATKTITNMVLSGTSNAYSKSGTRYVEAHGFAVGAFVTESLTFRVRYVGGTERDVSFQQSVRIDSVFTNSYSARTSLPTWNGPIATGFLSVRFISGKVYTGGGTSLPGRGAVSRVAHSRVTYTYFLPGVSDGIAALSDVTVLQPITFIGADGQETDTLSATTRPTQAEYQAAMAAGEEFVIESSYSQWSGNIYRMMTRTIPYQ